MSSSLVKSGRVCDDSRWLDADVPLVRDARRMLAETGKKPVLPSGLQGPPCCQARFLVPASPFGFTHLPLALCTSRLRPGAILFTPPLSQRDRSRMPLDQGAAVAELPAAGIMGRGAILSLSRVSMHA